ncbi:hypothetical protein QFC22_006183 [Naganishia vaughanmartiniae]|uniref:Uncharacterized protein n=1 Tax=Naganishia vaughanmartiniae TaxID=1424756 RepID=A0ACC2WNK9_9TREE|nr:hypothetical protein QFC22_006183 [Naganishia vaughanmartiniae]
MAIGPTAPLTHDSAIIIVGGTGTIGSSTALHLCRRGYKNISLLDVYGYPSDSATYGPSQSAGASDINKHIGPSNSGTRGEISMMTMDMWRNDPVFRNYYHEVGELSAASQPEHIADLRRSYEAKLNHPTKSKEVKWLGNREEIIAHCPHLAHGLVDGWQGIWTEKAGWGAANDAVDSVGKELRKYGVKMVFGQAGTFDRPMIDEATTRCIGVITKDGEKHYADRVVMATGAWSPSLIDLAGQCVSKCWIVAHLELSEEEARRYKSIPVVYNEEVGFCFEPRFIRHHEPGKNRWIIKLCDEFPGYTRLMETTPFGAEEPVEVSVPRSHSAHPTDTVPEEGRRRLRRVVEVMLPEFKEREFVKSYMCWCTDTADAEWLFCQHPSHPGLYLATGDSGHSFVTLPSAGSQVVDLLEGKASAERMRRWAWRPGQGDPEGTGRGGVAPKDLSELDGWAHGDDERAE